MSECPVCGRPQWNGGHAISANECTKPGDDFCRMVQFVREVSQADDKFAQKARRLLHSMVTP